MSFLIDTHIFIWSFEKSNRLSRSAIALLNASDSRVFLSMASIWEIQIKLDIGKFELARPLSEIIALQRQTNNLQILSIEPHHIYELSNLPMHHKDPFDRLLLAQSDVEKLPILSADGVFDLYNAQILR